MIAGICGWATTPGGSLPRRHARAAGMPAQEVAEIESDGIDAYVDAARHGARQLETRK
jgi:hypothetical protein